MPQKKNIIIYAKNAKKFYVSIDYLIYHCKNDIYKLQSTMTPSSRRGHSKLKEKN